MTNQSDLSKAIPENAVVPTEPELLEVLRFCNEVREALGLGEIPYLLKGECAEPSHCVITNTIQHGADIEFFREYYMRTNWSRVTVFRKDGPKVFRFSSNVYAFVRYFDGGLYPELIV